MKTAVILGVDGQDGSYLAEALLARGDHVVGVGRRTAPRYIAPSDRFEYLSLDVANREALSHALGRAAPDEIYHLAVVHGSAGFSYEAIWHDALAVNTGSVHTCLEHLRDVRQGRLFFASSLKAFGTPAPSRIDEHTPRRSECLYSITKNASTDLIDLYIQTSGIEAAVGYLFNHDSPRRAMNYFMPKLVRQLAVALKPDLKTRLADTEELSVFTLNFSCDWGASSEFMEVAIDLLRSPKPSHAVFATGHPWTGWDLATALSGAAGLDLADWVQVKEDRQDTIAPAPGAQPDHLRAVCGRTPRKTGLDVALWILRDTYNIHLEKPAQ